ncbi:hypothetical protein SAMN05660830_03113 [Halodesulfovibrio aestuarii]|uniref:Uncharacterized protein n=1 Tax=Halodesulfovibrio aestuarii TaxID=126333 RepID=A0A8G2FJ95_9BACT|nr:hypothetical protein SAMN05660830_03113 [Halodesulfovibrio aestuarii]
MNEYDVTHESISKITSEAALLSTHSGHELHPHLTGFVEADKTPSARISHRHNLEKSKVCAQQQEIELLHVYRTALKLFSDEDPSEHDFRASYQRTFVLAATIYVPYLSTASGLKPACRLTSTSSYNKLHLKFHVHDKCLSRCFSLTRDFFIDTC